MTWRLLPHVIVLLLTAGLCLGVAVYAWRRRAARTALLLALMMLASAEWTLAAAIEAAAVETTTKVFWSQAEYLGMASAIALLLLFAVAYTDRWHLVTRPRLLGLFAMPVLTVAAAWTNEWHGLVWPYFRRGDEAANVLVYGHGPWFWAAVVYYYVVLGASLALLLVQPRRERRLLRRQSVVVSAACLSPAIAGLVYVLDISPIPGLDWTPVGCAAMGLLLLWSLFRHRLLDVVPVAREALIEHLRDGVVVLGPDGLLLDANPAARRLLGLDDSALGRPWSSLGPLPELGRLDPPDGGGDTAVSPSAGEQLTREVLLGGEQGEPRCLEVLVVPLLERARFAGWLVTLRDVTQARRDSQLLRALTQDLEEQVHERTAELRQTVARLEREVVERRHAEEMLRQMEGALTERVAEQSRKLTALYEVIVLAGQSLDADQMRIGSLRKILAAFGGDAGCVHLIEGGNSLRLAAHEGLSAGTLDELVASGDAWLRPATSPADDCGETGTAQGVSPPSEFAAGMRAPIRLRGETVGIVSIFWRRPRALTADDASLFRTMADQLGIVMESARLHQIGEQHAVQRERRRLARDLHDSVTQSLHSLVLAADTATNRLSQGRLDRLETSLGNLAESARQALKEMRLLLFELRLAPLAEVDLVEALRTRLETVEQRAGIDARIDAPAASLWPKVWEADAYCIAMEALNNSLKHARASRVSVAIDGGPGWLAIEVADDGRGFSPDTASRGGMGLINMAERAERLGGRLSIDSASGSGTRIRLEVGTPHDSDGAPGQQPGDERGGRVGVAERWPPDEPQPMREDERA